MLPSQSTLAKDPSLFPLCGVGPAVPSGSPANAAGEATGFAADFGALIADLDPAELPADPTASDLIGCGLPTLAFVPPPVTLAPDPELAPGAGGALPGESDPTSDVEEENSIWGGSASVRTDWTGRGLAVGVAAGRGGETAHRDFGPAIASVARNEPGSMLPAAAISERALPTPRSVGLPTVALENRPSTTLPAGIARLQALHAETAPSAAIPDPVAAEVAPDTAVPRPTEFSGFAPGAPATFRGAVLTRSDHPGEAARAALERNGFVAGESIRLGSERVLPPEEKIAGRREGATPAIGESSGARKKSFLGSEEELLSKHGRSLGTDSAKPVAAMPATSLHASPTHPNSHYAVTAVAAPGELLPEVTPPAEVADTFSTAHEAVEVVLHAVEHVASREQKSVQLKFAVAGEELAVRVEMRADEVRTTFRTDSAELRAALEYEWQQVTGSSPAPDRSVRVSPAVFAGAGQSANAFAGDTMSRDRRAGTPRDESELSVAGIRGRTVAAAVHELTPPVTAAPARALGAHRLHTLA